MLASPLTLPCGATLPNRVAKAAMSEGLADNDNAPTGRLTRLYDRWSDSGAGLLITGNVMIDGNAIGEPANVVVEDDRHLELIEGWAATAAAGGAHAWVQINHPGRQVPRTLSRTPVAPSAVPVAGTGGAFGKPRELTGREIEDLIRRFATTAGVVVGAGFTGVQVHAAHGYLISQFLSPLSNLRTDEWGGTTANRRRFLIEVVRAVRDEIGPRTPLSVKLNSADFQRGGLTEDESVDVVLALADEGVDLLEVSGGTYESAAMMGTVRASTRVREAYFLDYAERVRAATALPLMLTGGFRTAAGMNAALTGGAVDVIGLGRPMALEPDLPRRLLTGTADASTARPRRVGIRKLDGASELVWYSVQMWRMGDGENPDPNRHPVRNLTQYLATTGVQALRRNRRGF